jgi:hypothetical protein
MQIRRTPRITPERTPGDFLDMPRGRCRRTAVCTRVRASFVPLPFATCAMRPRKRASGHALLAIGGAVTMQATDYRPIRTSMILVRGTQVRNS